MSDNPIKPEVAELDRIAQSLIDIGRPRSAATVSSAARSLEGVEWLFGEAASRFHSLLADWNQSQSNLERSLVRVQELEAVGLDLRSRVPISQRPDSEWQCSGRCKPSPCEPGDYTAGYGCGYFTPPSVPPVSMLDRALAGDPAALSVMRQRYEDEGFQ